jgi:hypothetical protein
MKPGRLPAIALVCASALLPAFAPGADWTPSAAPAIPGEAPGTAFPGQPSAGAPTPYQIPYNMPPAQGLPTPPFATADAAPPPEYDPETGRIAFDFAGLGLTQSRTDEAYLLEIELRGLPPEQVEVRPAGGGLLLLVHRTAETTREETLGDGDGYRRSWSFSSGQRAKRLPAPPDADLRAMQRVDAGERVQIRIPRRTDVPASGPQGAPGMVLPGDVPARPHQGQQP